MKNQVSDALQNTTSEDLDHLIVCPGCDFVHQREHICDGEVGACKRCSLEFVFPAPKRYDHTIAYALATIPLMIGSVSLPFLSMSRAGLSNQANLIEISLAFNDASFVLVGALFVAFVIVVPVLRALSLIYALWPLWRGKKPLPFAQKIFALSETLSPWGMAEIFLVGTGVSLIKVTQLARVEYEIAFWIFIALVLNLVMMNLTLHRKDIRAQLREVAP